MKFTKQQYKDFRTRLLSTNQQLIQNEMDADIVADALKNAEISVTLAEQSAATGEEIAAAYKLIFNVALDALENRSFDANSPFDKADKTIRAVLKSQQQPVLDGWKPIKTAPKDGTMFIGWDVLNGCTTIAFFNTHDDPTFNGFFHDSDWLGGAKLSHWQPLPSPPEHGDK